MEFKMDSRRRRGADLKARVPSACERPGASVAAIAMAHGLNANLDHKWRRLARPTSQSTTSIPAVELAPFIALGELFKTVTTKHEQVTRQSTAIRHKQGSCGVQLQALVERLRQEVLQHRVLHADETPMQMLKPGHGKTHRAYLWD